jgi:hypothetical protein
MSHLKSMSAKLLSYFVSDVAAGACHPGVGLCSSCGWGTHRRRSCAGHCYHSGTC